MKLSINHSVFIVSDGTQQQCNSHILSRISIGGYNAHDIANVIVPAYYEICKDVGVNPVLCIAQLIHETGYLTSWWSQRPRRNPAGIGVTGRTVPGPPPATSRWALKEEDSLYHEGVSFPSWKDDAVPAHVGRLLAYSLKDSEASAKQRQLISLALYWRPLPDNFRGSVRTIKALGAAYNPVNKGKPRRQWAGWAVPGFGYPEKLVALANAIGNTKYQS